MEIDVPRLMEIFKSPANLWLESDKKYIETLVKAGKRDYLKKLRSSV